MPQTRLWTSGTTVETSPGLLTTTQRRALKGGASWPELEGLTVADARAWLIANGYYYVTVITSGAEDDLVCSTTVGGNLTCCGFVMLSIYSRAAITLHTGETIGHRVDRRASAESVAGWLRALGYLR